MLLSSKTASNQSTSRTHDEKSQFKMRNREINLSPKHVGGGQKTVSGPKIKTRAQFVKLLGETQLVARKTACRWIILRRKLLVGNKPPENNSYSEAILTRPIGVEGYHLCWSDNIKTTLEQRLILPPKLLLNHCETRALTREAKLRPGIRNTHSQYQTKHLTLAHFVWPPIEVAA